MTTVEGRLISLDRIVSLLNARGIAAYVEETSGGVATVYVGAPHGGFNAELLAGSGWFEGPPGPTETAWADTGYLFVGPPWQDPATWSARLDDTEESLTDRIADTLIVHRAGQAF